MSDSAEPGFRLHRRLEADSLGLGRLPLSHLRLGRDSRFPWLILVPARTGAEGLHQLAPDDRRQLIDEVARASEALVELFRPDRVNVGALGNLVPQLHVHVVARFRDDAAWPGPVWGHGAARPYPPGAAEALADRLRRALGLEACGAPPC